MTLYPNGYGTSMITIERMRQLHEPRMHPEFARRFFPYMEHRGGLLGIGGGWRLTQPDKPGFAPDGMSFHQSQTFASGIIGYCAVDLVAVNSHGVNVAHRAPTWDETANAPDWGLHTFILTPTPEPWHMQPVEIRGWQTWVNLGRKDPIAGIPLPSDPPPPDDEDDMALAKIMIPTGSWAKDWYPHLACFDSGVIRPSMSSDLNPREGKGEVTDEGQYRRSCDAAGIQLTTPLPE